MSSELNVNVSSAVAAQVTSEPKIGVDSASKSVGLDSKKVAPQAAESESVSIDAQMVAKAIERLNDLAEAQQRDLKFSIDKPSGRTVVQVLDSESKQLIRQIPGDEILTLARQFEMGDLGALMDVVA